MLRRLLSTSALAALIIIVTGQPALAASGRLSLPINHRLHGILVDIYRPKLIFGQDKVSRGFVASRDGLVLAPMGGLEEVELGQDVTLEWMDNRRAQGWLVWKDQDAGYVIVRLLDPMPLFPAIGWSEGRGTRPGEELLAPGPLRGGQPTLNRAEVAGVRHLDLPSGRSIERAILLTPSLGQGPLSGPVVDERGDLVGMVTALIPPPGFGPQTVVAIPVDALKADLSAARSMRPPRYAQQPSTVFTRPSYSIGIGIGSGGGSPSIGFGVGGSPSYGRYGRYGRSGSYGRYGSLGTRPGWSGERDEYWLKKEQETTDRAQTEALERALEERTGQEPNANAALLTNSEPLNQQYPKGQGSTTGAVYPPGSPSAPGTWSAGGSTVTTSGGTGQVREVPPESFQLNKPAGGSTASASPPAGGSGNWPLVVEPPTTQAERDEQEAIDKARTEELERALAEKGATGTPAGAPKGEMTVMASPPASTTSSTNGNPSELDLLKARNHALERELELLKQSLGPSR